MLILLLMLWFSHLNKSSSEVTHPTDKNDKKIKQMKKMITSMLDLLLFKTAFYTCMLMNETALFFWQGSGEVDVSCESLSTTKGPVPGHPFPYSDHEALATEFLFTPTTKGNGCSERQSGYVSGICSSVL